MSIPVDQTSPLASYEAVARRVSEAVAELFSESDRGCVLVGGAMVDDALGALLRAFFMNDEALIRKLLTVPGSPISTFSSRIQTTRALGLLSEEIYRDLDAVRKIRNTAAHFDYRSTRTTAFAFSDSDVANRCRGLKSLPEAFAALPPRYGFVAFVSMVAAIFAEHAANASIARSHGNHLLAINMLLQVTPVVPFKEYLSKFAAFPKRSDPSIVS